MRPRPCSPCSAPWSCFGHSRLLSRSPPSPPVGAWADAARQSSGSLHTRRYPEEGTVDPRANDCTEDREQAADAEVDKEEVHRSVSPGGGDKVFLADDPSKLTGGGRKKLGNLTAMASMTVRAAIKERGGGASQANMCGQWADKTVAETANAAAAGDALAETAIKMIKQASAKAGDHGGRSG